MACLIKYTTAYGNINLSDITTSLYYKRNINFLFIIGSNWYRGACEDSNGNIQVEGKISLGFFKNSDYDQGSKYDGRGACFFNCQIFGLTGCEYNYQTNECWAHTKNLVRIHYEYFSFNVFILVENYSDRIKK